MLKQLNRVRGLARQLCAGDDGNSAVEFAFIAPIAVLVTLGAIETARAFQRVYR